MHPLDNDGLSGGGEGEGPERGQRGGQAEQAGERTVHRGVGTTSVISVYLVYL